MTAVDHAELKRVADWCRTLVNPDGAVVTRAMMVETLDQAADALDALLSEIEGLKAARDTAQSAVEAWAHVCESLEAHLQDRVAMRDEANPERYLSILRSNMARVQRDSEQIRAARWADYRRHEEEIDRLRTQAPDSWRPIETAPKDGTVIDVWREEGGRDTVFWGLPHHDCGEMGQYCDSDWHGIRAPGWVCSTFNEFVGRSHNPFTHWMPLPAAPALRPQTAESGE